MRTPPFQVKLPRIRKTVEAWESSCRCGSCETLHIRIIDDIDGATVDYNVSIDGAWIFREIEDDHEKMSILASVIFELARELNRPVWQIDP